MKNIFLVFGLCLMLCGCGEDAPPSTSDSYTPPTFNKNKTAITASAQPAPAQTGTVKTSQPAAPAATPAKDTKNAGQLPSSVGFAGGAGAVVDYGMGAVPLNIKRKQSDKIQSIQNQHNQATQKALNEK